MSRVTSNIYNNLNLIVRENLTKYATNPEDSQRIQIKYYVILIG